MDPTGELEVFRAFMGFSNSRSGDVDNSLVKAIKYVTDLITPPLVLIFNISLLSGEFHEDIKPAKVSVLFARDDRNPMTNYRKIYVLPILSKGLEKIILRRLDAFLEKRAVTTGYQFGVRKRKSTNSALLLQKKMILNNIENKLWTLGIFIDFNRAFDALTTKCC